MRNNLKTVLALFLCIYAFLCTSTHVFAQETVEPAHVTSEGVNPVASGVDSEELLQDVSDQSQTSLLEDVQTPEELPEEVRPDVVPVTQEIEVQTTDEVEAVVDATSSPAAVVDVHAQRLVATNASSSLNEQLPFTLVSDLSFEINEIPTFFFEFDKGEENPSLLESITNTVVTVVESIQDVYEGSIVETIVDTVVDAASSVVDFFLPQEVQGQEIIEDTLPSSFEVFEMQPEETPIDTSEQIENSSQGVLSTSSQPLSFATTTSPDLMANPELLEIETEETSSTTATTENESIPSPYALVDGELVSLLFIPTEVATEFVVTLLGGAFMPGDHALELHFEKDGETYVGYYIFNVEGTILQTIPLVESQQVLLISNQLGEQHLWLLSEYGSQELQNFEHIAGPELLPINPSFSFADDTLFWTTTLSDAVFGFDVVTKSLFSQTLNTNSSAEDLIETDEGIYEISAASEGLHVTFSPEVFTP